MPHTHHPPQIVLQQGRNSSSHVQLLLLHDQRLKMVLQLSDIHTPDGGFNNSSTVQFVQVQDMLHTWQTTEVAANGVHSTPHHTSTNGPRPHN